MSSIDYRKTDEDGRIPLSYEEYEAIRTIYGAINALELYHGKLEKRCRTSKNLWRDLRLLHWLSTNVLQRICFTIPVKKLKQMLKELNNMICEVKVKGASTSNDDEYIYANRETIIELCKMATELNCFCCYKTHDEAKKCTLYKMITGMYNYELGEFNECPFSEGL